jgi:hypothetical protein
MGRRTYLNIKNMDSRLLVRDYGKQKPSSSCDKLRKYEVSVA